ncbi:MAG: hypothetical protein Q9165_006355 [Trypethelium subeluteriae]
MAYGPYVGTRNFRTIGPSYHLTITSVRVIIVVVSNDNGITSISAGWPEPEMTVLELVTEVMQELSTRWNLTWDPFA